MKHTQKEQLEEQRKQVLEQLNKWVEDSAFIINGREYKLTKVSHQFRLQALSVYSQIEATLIMGNYGFLMQKEFKDLMRKVDEVILFEDMQISKLPNHFEEYAEDYLDYVSFSLKVITYPFYRTKLNTN